MPELVTFGDLKDRVAVRVGAARAADVTRIAEYCLEAIRDFWRRNDWPERRRVAHLQIKPIEDMTCDFVKGSTTVSNIVGVVMDATAWPVGHVGWQIVLGGLNNPAYEVLSVTGPDEVELIRPILLDTEVGSEAAIYQDRLPLPADCAEVLTEDCQLLDSGGIPLEWRDRLSANWNFTYANTKARPRWLTYGDHFIEPTTGQVNRTLRIGPGAANSEYSARVGYKNVYPGGSEDADPLLIPEDRRDIPMWGALMRAYSEPPWLNEVDALVMKQLYEAETSIADAAEHEGDADLFTMDGYDEGSIY